MEALFHDVVEIVVVRVLSVATVFFSGLILLEVLYIT